MQTQSGRLRRIKAFATEAGVSVRTLHLYDRLGLLRPTAVSESGYRLYGDVKLPGFRGHFPLCGEGSTNGQETSSCLSLGVPS
jgi:hypothetical protein